MKSWNLITFNIHKGVTPLRYLDVVEKIRMSLKESDADLVLLQEVMGEKKLSAKQVEKQLETLADTHWPHHAYGKNAVFPTKNHGNAVMSRVPILRSHNKDLSIHRLERRGLLHCELGGALKGLHLCTAHLDLLELTRSRQLVTLIDYIQSHVPARSPLILGGDFNDWSLKAGKLLENELGLDEHCGPSFPAWFPFLSLDRIYTRGVNVKHFRVLNTAPWTSLSDHLPLYLEFTFPKK